MSEFVLPVRVYYEDTDAGGVVYYANYLKFMERARTEWLRDLGFEQDVLRDEEGILFAVRSVKVDYLRPAVFNDRLLVSAEPVGQRGVSLEFYQEVRRGTEVLCRGHVIIVSIDARAMKPRRIPQPVLERLAVGA